MTAHVPEVSEVEVAKLRLDPQNPRLPEDLLGSDQVTLVAYLEEHDALAELASSFLANGYFRNEPLVVLPAAADGSRTVVEGNRRLATLKILLEDADAREAGLRFDLPSEPVNGRLVALSKVPVFEIADPTELQAYLGYRHISGIRRWSAEAKARFIASAVEETAREGSSSPFADVAKTLGSTTQAVRSSFVAIQTLRFGRDEYGVDVRPLLTERFAVWQRLLGTANVPTFLGLDKGTRGYKDVLAAIQLIDPEHLREVTGDLIPEDGVAVLQDSRDVTRYSDVLADPSAYAILRQYRDLDLAAQTVQGASIRRRIERLTRSCEVLISDLRRGHVDQDVLNAATDLAGVADSLQAVAQRALSRTRESAL